MESSMDFLLWVRGPAFNVAVAIFVIGVVARLLETLLLGRAPSHSEPKGSQVGPGIAEIFKRSVPLPDIVKRGAVTLVGGYIFHIGLFITIFLFVPHIEFINSVFGVRWPGLPNPVVDAVTVVTMVALVVLLVHRIRQPVKRMLSTSEDYLTWLVTFLPILTGWLAYHRIVNPYPLVLGLHILSVEVLMVVLPFTKLMHTFTVFISRWYNGAIYGRRGVQS
jgi:nitrate reductase gamma subunit